MSKEVKINYKWPMILPDSSADEWIGNMEWHHGTWEQPRLLKLEELIKAEKDSIVLYIGAYKGDMPALLASWGAKLFLVESTPAFWTLIEETWELNKLDDPVGTFSGLASDKTTVSDDFILKGWPTRKAEYIEGKVGFTHLAESGEDPTFPQITIDDMVRLSGIVPDIITMDCEGSEGPIMKGCIDTLKNHNAKYMMSLHFEFGFHNHGYYMRELFDLFEQNGYKWEYIDYEHEFHFLFTKK